MHAKAYDNYMYKYYFYADERPKYPMEQIKDLARKYTLDANQQEEFRKFAADEVSVVIQSCNEAEYYAALEKIKALPKFGKSVKYPSRIYAIVVGLFAGRNTAIVRTGQGYQCRNDLTTILGFFPNAKYLLGLGVCMGIQGKSGDVLIGKMLQMETNPKFENGTIKLRGARESITKSMKMLFCDDTRPHGWNFECTAEGRTSKVHQGCIFSSPMLINDRIVKKGLEGESQKLIGAEMEGWVLLTYFKHIDSIIIKGVSDYGDGTKEKSWQLTAAKAAVDYAHFKLEKAPRD